MPKGVNIDGVLVTWGDRLFYPGNQSVKGATPPKLTGSPLRQRANFIRNRIEAVVRRAPQVMVKVTGGGRSMRAIAAHLRYISKDGRLDIEDDRGETMKGPHVVSDLADDWRFSGSRIPEDADGLGRREAFNIMLSMSRGTDPLAVLRAAREFARVELEGHKYVMVLHDHQANPHVHVSVRAEGRDGQRLNPRKSDLHRWREVFAEKLREQGVDAEATRQAARGVVHIYDELWMTKARASGRLRHDPATGTSWANCLKISALAKEAWQQLRAALEGSQSLADRRLGVGIADMMKDCAQEPRIDLRARGLAISASSSIRRER